MTPRAAAFLALLLILAPAGCGRHDPHSGHDHADADSGKKTARYYCPMHPSFTSDKPGTCPICGMQLVPMPPEMHSPASAAANPDAASKTMCLHHDCSMLKEGKPCPMLIVAKPGEKVTCPVCGTHVAGDQAFDVQMESPDGYTVVVLSPEKQALVGVLSEPAAKRDLVKTVRSVAHVEDDLEEVYAPLNEPGLPLVTKFAALTLPTGQKLEGVVRSVEAVAEPSTRPARMRIAVRDPNRSLRRHMFMDVAITVPLGNVLAIPEKAVFYTGKKSLVFVDRGQGVYEPREVALGASAQGHYEVKSGLEAGENVVTNGNFLLDSESRIQAALRGAPAGESRPEHVH